MGLMTEITITKEYLRQNPDHIFIFGDNLFGKGHGGAAALRDEPNTLGFTTKKAPNNEDRSFYRPSEYKEIFEQEMEGLISWIKTCPEKTFLLSKIGSGLANRYKIWEKIIEPGIEELRRYPNVKFLF